MSQPMQEKYAQEHEYSTSATAPRFKFNDSRNASSVAIHQQNLANRYFRSRRIGKDNIEKPWLEKKDPRQRWLSLFPLIGLLIGLALSGYLVYDGLASVETPVYCSVYEDDFTNGFDDRIWTKEVEVGGYGNGQFEETTSTDENVFIKDGVLTIKPTLQDARLIETNNIINLTASGLCTTDSWSSCVTSTNTTNGTIVNPVKSARINTKKGASIQFGRIEVVAKLPAGDWLWPAIWMLPVNDTYGPWPSSGEIDLAESRGNNWTYGMGGNNIVSSTLHWGPDGANDAWWRTNNKQHASHTTYAAGFHTYGLEWTPTHIYTYIDTRLMQVLYTNFKTPFWRRGKFPVSDTNGTAFVDPWSQTGNPATPFDKPFYLILNVAVGGKNGWFEDGKAGKPWVDASPTARKDFWDAKEQWYPTWLENSEMQVKSVRMWQRKGYGTCK
ncbi:hypothetical protein A1O7_09129 [Cladophialophora yegresii CBS 114405]|uniref:GH16 domain-containing protein n=1 Tax=Cladophialophora yegresii CBS 114405 TaxID=1182544 RepID=W9VE74_9EURO|nr:uncharacterized protein A1O7_09129 [Cladophialophora yegresii CBS 114405]EXJ53793.1 hypothetical protein A1O7_09129 [Cladophialophora yegresii CBS 114405]